MFQFIFIIQLVVHVGVSGIATELTLEQQAHNNGYDKPDVKLMVPSTAVSITTQMYSLEGFLKSKLNFNLTVLYISSLPLFLGLSLVF